MKNEIKRKENMIWRWRKLVRYNVNRWREGEGRGYGRNEFCRKIRKDYEKNDRGYRNKEWRGLYWK